MRTISLKIEDSYLNEFINYVKNNSSKISIIKDPNLEYDPYFYERQVKLVKLREDVHSGKMPLLDEVESEKQMENFFKKLDNN
ncbi:hypothetical protein [Aliarcobacter lanthieri]|uniref:hypothetical protein n=1 Tax=Aliarcobacter lanthieri TaxID=1355374 RepID=UPI00047D4C34|nr:hypothetical protein [Aliarcobacter lanthieri]QKF59745.1 hypothetical protein ALANTH_1644 [Aliarcobacter lanthieri]